MPNSERSKNEIRKTALSVGRKSVFDRIATHGGTLEERVAVLEEVLQDQVMAVMEEQKGGD